MDMWNRDLRVVALALLLFALPSFVLASNDQVLGNLEQAQQQYMQLIQNVSLLVAFLGGVLSFLTPCALGILPAYFAYAFQEKKELVKMTLFFFLGLMVIFIPIGLTASYIGDLLVIYRDILALISGGLLILMGGLMILGKGFSFMPIKMKTQRSSLGVFLFGILFGIGFTPCNGPILIAITTLAATQTIYYSVSMLILYGLGMAIPLLVLSFFFDRFKVIEKLSKGHRAFRIMGYEFKTHWTGIVAGALFVVLGIVFILFRSTTIFTIKAAQLGYPLELAYNIQDWMIENTVLANGLAVLGLAIFVAVIYFTYRGTVGKKQE